MRVSIIYAFLFAFSLVAVAQVLGLSPMMLLRKSESAMISALQFTQRLSPVGEVVSLCEAYPLAALGVGHFLICLIYSLVSCAIVSRVLHRVD